MPTYEIQAPDGNKYRIDGPDGATDEQVRAQILKQHPNARQKKAASEEKPGFLRNLATGFISSAADSIGGALDMVGEATGIGFEGGTKGLGPGPIATAVGEAGANVVDHPLSSAASAGSSLARNVMDPTGTGQGKVLEGAAEFLVPGMAGVNYARKAAAAAPTKLFNAAKDAANNIVEHSVDRLKVSKEVAERDAERARVKAIEDAHTEEQEILRKEQNAAAEEALKARSDTKAAVASTKKEGRGKVRESAQQLRESRRKAAEKEKSQHSRAREQAGLPPADQANPQATSRLPDSARQRALEAHGDDMRVQKEDTSFKDYFARGQELADRGTPFARSKAFIDKESGLGQWLKKKKSVNVKAGVTDSADMEKKIAEHLEEVIYGREGPGGQFYPATLEVLDEEVRNLRYGQFNENLTPGQRAAYGRAYEQLESALKKYVGTNAETGKEYWPRTAYAKASERINQWATKLGSKFTAIQDVGFKQNPKNVRFKHGADAALREAFANPENAREFKTLVGEDSFHEFASQQLSNELHGKSVKQIEQWAGDYKNGWYKEVPGGESMLNEYMQSIAESERDLSGVNAAIKRQEALVRSQRSAVSKSVQELRASGASREAKASEAVTQAGAKSAQRLQAVSQKAGEAEAAAKAKAAEKYQKSLDGVTKSMTEYLTEGDPKTAVARFRAEKRPHLESLGVDSSALDQMEAELSNIDERESRLQRAERIKKRIGTAFKLGAGYVIGKQAVTDLGKVAGSYGN